MRESETKDAMKIKRFPAVDGELGWLETAPGHDERIGHRLKGRHQFDFAIVGGGFTGLSVAQRLAELHPAADIAVLDALRIGEGTSGRNAGFIIDLPHNLDATKQDVDADLRLRDLNRFAIARLDDMRRSHGIECQWTQVGKYMGARENRNLSGLDGFVDTLSAMGASCDVLSGSELFDRLGTDFYQRAVYTPDNVLVNPAALVRGLARALPSNVQVFEQSPVISLDRGTHHRLSSRGGELRAKAVVLCVNSFGAEFGTARNRLAPIFTYASLTPSLGSEQAPRLAKLPPWGLTSAHPAGTTVRHTPDHRIFVRNTVHFEPGLRANEDMLVEATRQHRISFERRFPDLAHVDFEFTWGGMLCMTLNHQPFFKEGGDSIYTVIGCNGVGVAKGTYLGYYMAELISGRDSKELASLLRAEQASWVPPDPFRTIGARFRLTREQRTAGQDV